MFVLRKYDRRRGDFVFYRSTRGGGAAFGPLQMADTFDNFGDAMKVAKGQSQWLDVVPKPKGA